jgi:predicted  nucleic acid-binding Zn-ribbon protein
MDILKRLLDSRDSGDEGTGEAGAVGYWCAACGMTFRRSCSEIEYSWCARCGATEVRRIPRHGTVEPAGRGTSEAPVARDAGPREGSDDPQRRA